MSNDFVVSARLIADASGLRAGTREGKAGLDELKRSGDQAAAGARQVEAATGAAAAGTRTFGAAARQAAGDLRQTYGGATALQAAMNGVQQATHPVTGSQAALAGVLRQTKTAYDSGALSATAYARVLAVAERNTREAARAGNQQFTSLGQQRMGYMMLGQQIQDIGMQLAMGTDVFRVLAMQAGQTAMAVQQMGAGGVGGAVARFIANPFGSAILAAASIVAMFGSSLLGATNEAEQNEAAQRRLVSASDALGQAQGALAQMFDLNTGRIRSNTEALRANIIMQAQALRAQGMQQVAGANLFRMGAAQRVGAWDSAGAIGAAIARSADPQAAAQWENLRNIAVNSGLISGRRTGPQIDRAEAVRLFGEADTSALRRYGITFSGTDLAGQVNNLVQGEESVRIANDMLETVRTGRLDPRFRQPGGGGQRRRRGDGGASRLAEFGSDAGTRISELAGQFQNTPAQVTRVTKALADLDDLLEDIEERKPPNYQRLLEQGRAARQVIEEGINRPYLDFLDQQRESLDVQHLIAQGRDDEAQALQIIQRLEERMGPLTQERKDTILLGVQALRAEQRQLEINQAQLRPYLEAIKDVRAQLTDVVQGGLMGDVKSLLDAPGRLFGTYTRLNAEVLAEDIFGNTFRELQDMVNGTNIVEDAAQRFRAAADSTARSLAAVGDAAVSARTGVQSTAQQDAAAAAIDNAEIVVTANRDPRVFFERMVTRLAEGVVGEQTARTIGRLVGRAMQGATYGAMVSGGLSSLGISNSRTGSMVGGAIGNALGKEFGKDIGEAIGGKAGELLGKFGGPLGSIAGSLIGGFAGKILSGGAKTGSATIGMVDGAIGVSGTRGSSSSFRTAAGTAAGSIIDTLNEIAAQFGGSLTGTPSVSIGIRNGNLRVDPTGKGKTKTSKGAIDFGEDEGAAIAFAALDALRDGVVGGMSAAVQKALTSSNDLQKAVREALKVQELEDLLSDMGSSASRELREFERTAKERVRIARAYGFDLVKIEELNAKERAAVTDRILASRVGALKELLEDLNFGDLFEGSLADRRTKLLGEVSKAEADAEAGVEGAADRLAALSRQLVELSRDAYGTAGPEFASDRGRAISSAERVIELENERIRIAQEQARQTNEHLDEVNDQLAIGNSINRQQLDLLERIAANTSGGGPSFAPTGRSTELL